MPIFKVILYASFTSYSFLFFIKWKTYFKAHYEFEKRHGSHFVGEKVIPYY